MAEESFVRRYAPKLLAAFLLTFASGLVDIVGYTGVFHFFTAHLTGTTVQLGHGLASHAWRDVSAAATIVAAFVGGSILGRVLIQIGSRKRVRRIASLTLAIEGLLLALIALAHFNYSARPYWGLGVLAMAMGIQTATLTGVGPLTVHTTFVTGMLNKVAQLASRVAFRAYDHRRSGVWAFDAHREQRNDIQVILVLLVVWLSYVGGAIAGTLAFESAGLRSLFIAIGLLTLALVCDQVSPLSIEEEKEQSER